MCTELLMKLKSIMSIWREKAAKIIKINKVKFIENHISGTFSLMIGRNLRVLACQTKRNSLKKLANKNTRKPLQSSFLERFHTLKREMVKRNLPSFNTCNSFEETFLEFELICLFVFCFFLYLYLFLKKACLSQESIKKIKKQVEKYIT
jgi:hypothetical protein